MTAEEVVLYGPTKDDYPTDHICNHINRIEKKVFRDCFLGTDFRQALIDDLKDISAEFYSVDNLVEYNIGDLIVYNGITYESTIDSNEVHPDDNPRVNPAWVIPDKFNKEAYNDLWKNILAEYLAYSIIYGSLEYSTYQISAKGVTMVDRDATGIATVEHQTFVMMKRKLYSDIQNISTDLYDYMKDAGLLPETDDCSTDECLPKPRRRRMIFKTIN